MLLSDFFQSKYAPRRLRGKSPNSYRLYELCIRRFGESLKRPARVADLTNDNLLLHLSTRREVAPATRNKELAGLCAMWRLAVQLGLHEGWPDVQAESEPQRAPRAWLADEFAKLLTAAKRVEGSIGSVPAWLYWTSMLYVALDTAERVGALLECEWSWLDGDRLLIRAEARKGSREDKQFVLSDESVQILSTMHVHSTSRKIFDWPYHPTYFWRKYREVVKSAGLPTGRDCGLHRVRKSSASALYAAGLNAQQALGHSDSRVTARYIDQRFVQSKEPSTILRQWLRGELPLGQSQRKQA